MEVESAARNNQGAGANEPLSPKELGARWRCSPDTIYRRIADGTLPAYKIGRQYRIKAEDAERAFRAITERS